MKHRIKLLLGGAALAAALASAVWAQTVVQTSITGNEVWQVGQGPGGPGAFIGINTVRGSTNIVGKSGSGSATSTGIAGTTVWVGTAPTTWTITLPSAPANGTISRYTTDTTLTTMVTVQAGSGDTMSGTFSSQTLTANTTVVAWQYLASTKIWYRIQ